MRFFKNKKGSRALNLVITIIILLVVAFIVLKLVNRSGKLVGGALTGVSECGGSGSYCGMSITKDNILGKAQNYCPSGYECLPNPSCTIKTKVEVSYSGEGEPSADLTTALKELKDNKKNHKEAIKDLASQEISYADLSRNPQLKKEFDRKFYGCCCIPNN